MASVISELIDWIENRYFKSYEQEEIAALIYELAAATTGSEPEMRASACFHASQAGLHGAVSSVSKQEDYLPSLASGGWATTAIELTAESLARRVHAVQPGTWKKFYRLTCAFTSNELESNQALIIKLLDSLIRHIEIRRSNCLRLSPVEGGSEVAARLSTAEKCGFAVVLARSARIWADARYLNTALQLNTLLLRAGHHAMDQQSKALLLLALCEQEHSAVELL